MSYFVNKVLQGNAVDSIQKANKSFIQNFIPGALRALYLASFLATAAVQAEEPSSHAIPDRNAQTTQANTNVSQNTPKNTQNPTSIMTPYLRVIGSDNELLAPYILGLRWLDRGDAAKKPLNYMVLRNWDLNIAATYNDNRPNNDYDFEKNYLGKKEPDESKKLVLVNANLPYFLNNWIAAGVFAHQDTFSSAANSEIYSKTGYTFFSQRDKFNNIGGFGSVSTGGSQNAIGAKLNIGTAMTPKGVALGAQNQFSIDAEFIHKSDFDNFAVMWMMGATAATTTRTKTTSTTSTTTSSASTAPSNPLAIDNTLSYPAHTARFGFFPGVRFLGQGDSPTWNATILGQWQQETSGKRVDAQKYIENLWRVSASFEKKFGKYFGASITAGYGEINNVLRTRAYYYNQFIYEYNRTQPAANRINVSPALVDAADFSRKKDTRQEFDRFARVGIKGYIFGFEIEPFWQHSFLPRNVQFENGYRTPDWRHPHTDRDNIGVTLTRPIDSTPSAVSKEEINDLHSATVEKQLVILDYLSLPVFALNSALLDDLKRKAGANGTEKEAMKKWLELVNQLDPKKNPDAFQRVWFGLRDSRARTLLEKMQDLGAKQAEILQLNPNRTLEKSENEMLNKEIQILLDKVDAYENG